MRFRIWLYASSAVALILAGVLVARSEAGSLALARMESSLFQAEVLPLDRGEDGGQPSAGPGGRRGSSLPPGYEIPTPPEEIDPLVEAYAPGGAAGVDEEEEVPAEQNPFLRVPTLEEVTPQLRVAAAPEGQEEPISQLEVMQARIEALEGSLAELEATRQAQAEQIAELEAELEGLNRRGEFLEENRAARIDRLESGMEGMVQVDRLLAQGSGDLDRDLGAIAQELAGAASDASRYAGEQEARLAADAQASVQAAREALGRSDLFNARVHLGRAMQLAREARVAAEAGTQKLFP